MFEELLHRLSKVSVPIIWKIDEDWDQIINTLIFKSNFVWDVIEYKKVYFKKLRFKEIQILNIQENVYKENLSENEKNILLQEIENRLLKLEFLRYIYNTEAQKIDSKIKVFYPYSIEIYNKAFFWVTKKDVWEHILPQNNREFKNIYSKVELLKLIKKAKFYCPEMEFKFWKYQNFSHNSWVLKIPNQKYYNIQNIITLFFHETTHFFRSFNGKRNLWFSFRFTWHPTLEEGMAIYNEYYYWNKICDYWVFVPYYNICIKILLTDICEEEKKNKIYEILSWKGFSRERSNQYYNRFYKYCDFWWTHLFLKDLIYYNWYKNVKRLIKKDSKNYENIMAWDIGIKELEQQLITSDNNFNHRKFFLQMTKEINKIHTLN